MIEATVEKLSSLSTITNLEDILGSLENNMQTNLEFEGAIIDDFYYGIVPEPEMSRVSGLLKEQLEIK